MTVKQIINSMKDPADRMALIAVFTVAQECHVDMINVMREKLGTYGLEQFERVMGDWYKEGG